jgi:5-methylcytosine-specific restriction endonuclease McrA
LTEGVIFDMEIVATPKCAKCALPKERRGEKWVCPPCAAEYHRSYYERNRERLAAANRANYEANRQAYVDRATAWKRANPDRLRDITADYYDRHRSRILTTQAERYANDPTPFRVASDKWQAENNAARRAMLARRRARIAEAICEHGATCVSTDFLAALYGRACVYCGSVSAVADHLFPIAGGGLHCANNIVPACSACNLRKAARDPFEWLLSLL